MNLRNIFCTLFFIFPLYIFGSITGTYEVKGRDAVTDVRYTGSLVIDRVGQVYTAAWSLSTGETAIGTGVKKGDSISFVFQEFPSAAFGVQLYEIDDDRLSGPWAIFGTTVRGFERARKIDSSCSSS